MPRLILTTRRWLRQKLLLSPEQEADLAAPKSSSPTPPSSAWTDGVSFLDSPDKGSGPDPATASEAGGAGRFRCPAPAPERQLSASAQTPRPEAVGLAPDSIINGSKSDPAFRSSSAVLGNANLPQIILRLGRWLRPLRRRGLDASRLGSSAPAALALWRSLSLLPPKVPGSPSCPSGSCAGVVAPSQANDCWIRVWFLSIKVKIRVPSAPLRPRTS